jgi:sugar phosphate isomerase/epimerase
MLSVSTVLFDGHPMEAGFDLLAARGIDAVEPAFIKGYVDFTEADFSDAAAARLSRSIAARGLTVQALSAHMDLSGEDADAAISRRIDFAAALESPFLITNTGPADAEARVRAVLDRAARQLEDAAVTLALENPGHGRGDLIGTPEQAASLIRSIDQPHIALNVDIGNFATYGGSVEALAGLPAALDHAVHVHLKDFREIDGDWRFTGIGDGEMPWGEILETVGHLPLGLELPLRLRRPGKGDPLRANNPVALDEIRVALERSIRHIGKHIPPRG